MEAVAAPPATPPRYSLLFVAAAVKESGDRWQAGVQWAPETTLGGGLTSADCFGSTDTLNAGSNPGFAEAHPFVIWAEDHCSTLLQSRDLIGRALRQLDATRSFRVAAELWSGALAQADSLDNPWLTDDPDVLTVAALSPDDALARVDMGLGRWLGGRRGMIHVSVEMLDALVVNNALQLNNQVWLTAAGTLVVADAGYPGTGPDAGTGATHQWIYGTPLIQYRLGPAETNPPGEDGMSRAQATDRATNLTTYRAQQQVLLQWDATTPIGSSGKTGVLAAETTMPAFAAL